MSIPCGILLDQAANSLNDPRTTADETWKKQLLSKLNESYQEVASSYPWQQLKRTITLTDDVYIVPADCLRILRVIDENKQPYNFVGGKSVYSAFNYNWYWDTPIETVLASGATLAVSDYGTAVTATAEFPATTCVGEYIRIGSNAGLYKISAWASTSSITLADYFRGVSESQVIFSIRPIGTPVLAFTGPSATAISPTDVEITYIKTPLPLSRDEDIIELPGDCSAVRIKTEQKLLAMVKRDWQADRMKEDYVEALGRMKALEPEVPVMRPNLMFSSSSLTRSTPSKLNLVGY